jgi:hypothetical protein
MDRMKQMELAKNAQERLVKLAKKLEENPEFKATMRRMSRALRNQSSLKRA